MTTGTVKTQGSELWVVNPISGSEPDLLRFACPTGISGLGGPKSQIEDTCLDATVDKTYQAGLGDPGQVTVPFNFIPSNNSHQILFDLKELGTVLPWLIGLSDGTAAPTVDTDGEFVVPTSPNRTTIGFDAFISDVNIDIAGNDIVKGTLLLQRSGPVVPHWNGPTPT